MTSKTKSYCALMLSQFEESVTSESNPMINASWDFVGDDAPELLQGMADILKKLSKKCEEESINQIQARHIRKAK